MSRARDIAAEVLSTESAAIGDLIDRLDETFDEVITAIDACEGRIIVAGMGKSGLVGRKIAATLTSTGRASFFLHPAEAAHGDIGVLQPNDILILVSKSGRIEELAPVIAVARRFGVRMIALCGTPDSPLATRADLVLDCSVATEACPNNLVPTASTAAALAMGDAIAMALLDSRSFSAADFAELHPGGTLGRRLLLRVSEVHHSGDTIPIVSPDTALPEMMVAMSAGRLGAVFTVDTNHRPVGVFTDGDLRRLLETKPDNLMLLTAREIMHAEPKSVPADALLDAALNVMETHKITQLATVDESGRLVGVLHLHDILQSKLV